MRSALACSSCTSSACAWAAAVAVPPSPRRNTAHSASAALSTSKTTTKASISLFKAVILQACIVVQKQRNKRAVRQVTMR